MFRPLLRSLLEHQRLGKDEAQKLLLDMVNGVYTDVEMAALLTAFCMRPLALSELEGFAEALMSCCVRLDFSTFNTLDICGTGGDDKHTFNISTLTALVVAGTGQKVVKHGNYAVSSHCGSSDVLEHVGYVFTSKSSLLKKQLEEANICFLHAPLFHPCMKRVRTVRKALGLRTFFNILGPLVNPSRPNAHLLGACTLELARLYHFFLQPRATKYTIVHSVDGYDEISNTGHSYVLNSGGQRMISPQEMGLQPCQAGDLHGGQSVAESAEIFLSILSGKGTLAQNEVIIANAAWALRTAEPSKSLLKCVDQAKTSLESKQAWRSFQKLLA